MLRNRGVNVTERRIRHDVLRAYEYDIFDVPRWRCMQEAGCHAHYYRQPRYRTVPKPVYHTVRSSITNYRRGGREYGARRVYLPENEWGASSAESMVFVRNPRYNTGSYYPNEVIERPFRKDLRYPDGYYSRRPSSIYMEDDEIENYQATRYRTASYGPRKQTQLARKVTRKLSPIFKCDCTTSSNVKHPNTINTDNDSPKLKQGYLSKEAKNLSLDIFKILCLLRNVDGDDDELLSSLSLLQNIHDLDCRNSKSLANLITQRVQISPKMKTQKHDDPSEKFRAATSVKSKLEALVSALKQYEKEKMLSDLAKDLFSSEVANDPKYNNVIPSDPPSLEVRSSMNGQEKKSSTTIVDGGKLKDIVLQTEKPKTSNKNVCGMIKTKKDNMVVERKSLRSRLSWKKREGPGIKLSNDSSKERFTYKIGSILETKQSLPEKESGRQGQATNKAGLMIKIGGNLQRKKPKAPKEKNKDKMPTTWIRKFLDNTKDSKNNNIYLRWNNKAFYAKSSSTIFELVNNVYKQLGIKDYAKSDEISISDIKKVPKRKMHKSKSKIPRSSNKPKYKQKLKAYMMPETIVPGPVYMPGNVTNFNKHEAEKASNRKLSFDKTKSSLCELPLINGLNTTTSDYFEKCLPKDLFCPVSTAKNEGLRIPLSDEQVYQIIEYETIPSDSVETSIVEGYDFNSVGKYDLNKDVYLNMVQVSQSLCFTKRSDIGEINIESRPTKSLLQIRDFPDQDTTSFSFLRSCSLVDKIMEDECQNWMPLSSYSLPWTDICKDSDNTVLSIHDPDDNIISLSAPLENVDNGIETINHYDTKDKVNNKLASKNTKKMFRAGSNYTFGSNPILLKETISDSLIGINNGKTDILTLFWSLFWGFLKTPKHKRTPHPDLSLVKPPKTVSEPNCSYKPQNRYQPQQLWSSATVLRTVNVRKPKKTINFEKQPNLFKSINLVHPLSSEKDKKEEQAPIPRTTSELMKWDGSVHNTQTTEELENAFVLDKSSVPIKFTESKSNKIKPDVPLTSKKPSRFIGLRRSYLHIQTENMMKFVTKPSAPILKQDLRQRQLLFIHILNAEQGIVHFKSKSPTDQQSANPNQTTHISCKSDLLQDDKLKLDVNRGQEEISERSLTREGVRNSVDMLSKKIDSKAVIKGPESVKTLKTIRNKHEEVRNSVVMLSNEIDSETIVNEQESAKSLKTKRNKHEGVMKSVVILSNEIDSEAVIKRQESAKTLNSNTERNKHERVRNSVVMLSNPIDSETVIKEQESVKFLKTKRNKHEGVRKSVVMLSNEIDSDAIIKGQEIAKTLKSKIKRNKHAGVRNSVVKLSNVVDSETELKGQGRAKAFNSITKQTKHVTYVSHISTLKNDVSSSNQQYINFNKAAPMKLSLKITNGDKITKISIKKRDINKVNSTKFTNQANYQETAGVRRDRIHQSTNTIPNKKVKVFINIKNTNPEKINNENQMTGHLNEDRVPKEATDEDHMATKNTPDVQNNTTSAIPDSQHNSVYKSHSLSKSHTYITNMCAGKKLPVYVMEATSPNKICGDLIAVDETNCIDSYLKNIAAKNDVKQVLNNNVGKTAHNNLVEIERTLNAMMILNASEFAEIAEIYVPDSEKNKIHTSLRERMLRRKELVKFLSTIKIMNRDTDDFEDNPKLWCDKESYDKLESGDSCSRCNVLTRKLNSYRLVAGSKPTNYNFKEKTNIAANYNIPRLIQKPCKALEKDLAFHTMESKLNSAKRKEKTYQEENSILWYCGKKPHKKKQRKKWNNKENIKELKSDRRNNDAIVLTYIDPCMSHRSSFSEYKVNFKNGGSFLIKKDNSEIHKVDILQSDKVKKAVLQIYSETVTNDGYLVAKIPKYLRL